MDIASLWELQHVQDAGLCVASKSKTLLLDGIATNPLNRERGRVIAEGVGTWAALPVACPLVGRWVLEFSNHLQEALVRSGHWSIQAATGWLRSRNVLLADLEPGACIAVPAHLALVKASQPGLLAGTTLVEGSGDLSGVSIARTQIPFMKAPSLLSKHPLRLHL